MSTRKLITRKGKIARLPYAIRMEVNLRIRDGHSNEELAKWLNDQPAVKTRLAEIFWSAAITSRNVSEWRHGGFAEWLARIEQPTHG